MWKVVTGAVIGRSHEKLGLPCQDRVFSLQAQDFTLIALADGAGSKRNSQYGASTVIETIGQIFAKSFDEIYANQDGVAVKKYLVETLLKNLDLKAQELDCKRDDLSSTLLFVAVKDERFILGHIGDGVIFFSRDHEIKIASTPKNGEFANETVFVTSKQALSSFNLIKGQLNGIDGFILMSDGSAVSFYDKAQHSPAKILNSFILRSKLLAPEKMNEFLACTLEDVIKKNTIDDCSIALMAKADLKEVQELSTADKMQLLRLDRNKSQRLKKKLLGLQEQILELLQEPLTFEQLNLKVATTPHNLQKNLKRLSALGLITQDHGVYKRS